jgi:hypothetical protein
MEVAMTESLAARLAAALRLRADQLEHRNDTTPGWGGPDGRGRKAERLRDFASHLSSEQAAPVLKEIADLEPIYGPLGVAWAVEIAEMPESARGITDALSYLAAPDSVQKWLVFLRTCCQSGAIVEGRGDQ